MKPVTNVTTSSPERLDDQQGARLSPQGLAGGQGAACGALLESLVTPWSPASGATLAEPTNPLPLGRVASMGAVAPRHRLGRAPRRLGSVRPRGWYGRRGWPLAPARRRSLRPRPAHRPGPPGHRTPGRDPETAPSSTPVHGPRPGPGPFGPPPRRSPRPAGTPPAARREWADRSGSRPRRCRPPDGPPPAPERPTDHAAARPGPGWSPRRPDGRRRPPGPWGWTRRPRRRGREPLPDLAARVGRAPGPAGLAPAPCPPALLIPRTVAITPAAPVRRTQSGPSPSIQRLGQHTA